MVRPPIRTSAPFIRDSHLRRLGWTAWDEGLALVREFAPDDPDSIITLLERGHSSDDGTITSLLKDEYADIIVGLENWHSWVAQDWNADLVPGVVLTSNLRLDASVKLDRDDRPFISISFGLCLALDDALLGSFSRLGFLASEEVAEGKATGLHVLIAGEDASWRYHDYRSLRDAPTHSLAAFLTRSMPVDISRLAQQDLMMSFALRWVVMHEQAHWMLGHFGWMNERGLIPSGKVDEIMMTAADPVTGKIADHSYIFEMQADALATQILIFLGLSRSMDQDPSLMSYRQATSGNASGEAKWALGLDERMPLFRALLLSAIASSLLFELRRQTVAVGSITHPPPAARILNICMTAILTFGDIARVESGDHSDSETYELELLRPAIDATVFALHEVDIIARALNIESPMYRSELLHYSGNKPREEPGDWSPLISDLMTLITDPHAGEHKFLSPGGAFYAGLLGKERMYYEELEPHSRARALRSSPVSRNPPA